MGEQSSMRVTLSIAGDSSGQNIAALRDWLRNETALRSALLAPQAEQEGRGHMGPSLDLIDLFLEHFESLASLLFTVLAWRNTRPTAPSVQITHNGITVTLDSADPDAIRRVAEALQSGTANG
ncbi:effector-associated constant component EACC1 [Streptomyces iconiensis]|uniref:Uncharacterized protein n=1 Tax=Streptomyces iconiensis TaxID=1384038 RepID=A0ABT6ZZ72_9ACTN|nr:hypothetical protein [Streptomyces iconiensis]MDJ1134157.1 hypothetical protein [Streptomyces iconiensis]